MCGADDATTDPDGLHLGSSPRVRSRPQRIPLLRVSRRIISACAEQTSTESTACGVLRDHLRVCGADEYWRPVVRKCGGSSPRVRSRHHDGDPDHRPRGIISACAEQTLSDPFVVTLSGDHLRVCGADRSAGCRQARTWGSSPRVRSRPVSPVRSLMTFGIISACAEQTAWTGRRRVTDWDHLRVCGADTSLRGMRPSHSGSSPRVRSRRRCLGRQPMPVRIISACAEQTRLV